jgi:hypothetical protein
MISATLNLYGFREAVMADEWVARPTEVPARLGVPPRAGRITCPRLIRPLANG